MFFIAWRGLRGQKRMMLLMVAVLLVSFLFLTLSSVVCSSVRDFQQKQREALYGRHQLLYVGTSDFAQSIEAQFDGVEISRIAGKIDGKKTIGSISESYQQVANLTLLAGRLPQGENEILLVDPGHWDQQVGDRLQVRYQFSYIFQQAGETAAALREAFLGGLQQRRSYYLEQVAQLWDPFVQSEEGASALPADMLHPICELAEAQQDEAFLQFAASLPDFAMNAIGDRNDFEAREFGNLQAYLISSETNTVLKGIGFGTKQGTTISSGRHLVSAEVSTVYTVCGIAASYESQWNAGGPVSYTHLVGGLDTELTLAEESSGTKKIFSLLRPVITSLLRGTTLVVDELDAKLHPQLLRHIITLFGDRNVNKKGAQLVFTSHDLATMTSEIFRRDEIWFVAKGNQQNSKLYSLVEFKDESGEAVRKDAKFDKQYLEGRYGADPYLRRLIRWEDLP